MTSFEQKPTIKYIDGVAYYIWDRFEIRIHPDKGWAVYARVDIKSYDAIVPYGGVEIFEELYHRLMMKDPSEKVLQYIVDGNDGKSAGLVLL